MRSPRPLHWLFPLALALLVSASPAQAAAQAVDWALRVIEIAYDGTPRPEGAPLIVVTDTQRSERSVKPGDTFPVSTVLITPARTRLTLKSSNDNTLTLLPGTRLKASSGSDRGEHYTLDEGKASFIVRKALDFFNVEHEKFQALVRGTAYSVEVIPRKEIRFAVDEGKVRIEREEKFTIKEGQKEGAVTVADTLSAGEHKNYRLDIDDYLKTFSHFGEAEAYYRKNLEADRASGDTDRLSLGLNQMGIVLRTLSRYAEALPFYEERLSIERRRHPDGLHRNIAGSLDNLGNAYSDLGGTANVQRAIGYYEEAFRIDRQLFPDGIHEDIAINLDNFGAAYYRLGGKANVQRAIGYYEEALLIRRQLFPDGIHKHIASVLTNLGVAYVNLGGTANVQRAIGYYEEAFRIDRQLFPDGIHDDIAAILTNFGQAYLELGGTANVQRAIGYSEEALRIRRQLFPDGIHEGIAGNLINLGVAYHELGGTANVQRAIGYSEEALRISRQLFPDGMHDVIAMVLINLGEDYRYLDGLENLQRAIDYYDEGLRIRRQLFPDGIYNDIARIIAIVLNNLGEAYRNLGGTTNVQRAIGYYEEALRIRRQLFPDGMHYNIASVLDNLGNAYSDLGGTANIQRAIGYYEEALRIRRQLFPDGGAPVAGSLGSLAFSRMFSGDYAQALKDAREALKLAPDQLWIHTNEAHALLFLGRYDEARAIYANHRNEKLNPRQTFRDAVLDDFSAFRKAGLNHPDMARIEKMLR